MSPHRLTHVIAKPRSAGFTLAEVIVAISVLVIAVLALASTGTRVLALGRASMLRIVATSRALSVIDSLRAGNCRMLVSGSDSSVGVRVTWVIAPGAASRTVLVSAAFADPAAHRLQLEGGIPCD